MANRAHPWRARREYLLVRGNTGNESRIGRSAGDRNASLGDPGTPRLMRSIIGNAKSDMVDTTGSELRPRLIGAFLDHDQCSRATRPDFEESGSCVRAFFLPKAKP